MATRIGIALGGDRAVAIALGSRAATPVSEPFRPPAAPESPEPELARVFIELAHQLEAAGVTIDGARAHVALAPPLADVRIVGLPALKHDELLEVLRRDASRHFLGSKAPKVVGVGRKPVGAGQGGQAGKTSRPVLAAAAPLAVVDGVRAAARKVGWSLQGVVAAHAAWISVAAGQARGGRATMLAITGRAASIVTMESGAVASTRQASATDPDGVLDALGPGSGSLVLMAPDTDRTRWADTVTRAGWIPETAVPGGAVPAGTEGVDALEIAAAGADVSDLELISPALAAGRAARTRRRAIGLGVAAGVLLVLAAGVHLWGIHRQLDAVRRERLAISEDVGPLLASRDSLEALTERVDAMGEMVAAAPKWTPALVELSALLPRDVYLTSLFAIGDTLEIEAAGSRAGEAIQELRASSVFRDVRLEGVVERELENGETVVERFRVSTRLSRSVDDDEGGTE